MAGILALQYQDEDAAREHLEKLRWPDGPVCPKCSVIHKAYKLTPQETKEGGKGTHVRKGVWKCGACQTQFSLTIGTVFEDSHIPLHKWLLAIHLMCRSKKGISAHQLWRNLWGINPKTGNPNGSYRTAWFMAHRIRWALGQEPLASKLAGIIEIGKTFLGTKKRTGNRGYEWSASGRPKPGPKKHKMARQ